MTNNLNFSFEKEDLELINNHLADFLLSFKKKSFLISGASGFFGRNLLEALIFLNETHDLDIKIYAVSRNIENFAKKFPLLNKTKIIIPIESDISHLTKFDYPVDFIIHAACDTSVDVLQKQPESFLRQNYEGTRNMLEIAKNNKHSRFLYVSSGAVYGSQNHDVKHRQESDLGALNLQEISSTYGEAKRLGEMLCTIYHQQYNIDVKIARCFSFLGPYMNFDGHYAVGNFIRDVALKQDISLKSSTKTYRSYLYSIDLIIWLLKILLTAKNNIAYNVGSSQEILIEDLASLVVKTLDSNSKINYSKEVSFNTSSSSRYIPSNEKAISELGLKEITSLENSIEKTFNWYQRNNKL